jgi:uncharacterized protein YkwD
MRSLASILGVVGLVSVSGCVSAQSPGSSSGARPAPSTSAPTAASSNVAAVVVAAVNAERVHAGLRPLVINARLTEAARIQAEQMVTFGRLEHTISRAA